MPNLGTNRSAFFTISSIRYILSISCFRRGDPFADAISCFCLLILMNIVPVNSAWLPKITFGIQ